MSVCLAIGGLRFLLENAGEPPAPLRPFVSRADETGLICRCHTGRVAPVDEENLLFESGGIWCLDRARGDAVRIVLRRGGPGGVPFHALELSAELDRGIAVLDPDGLPQGERPFGLREPLLELWACFVLLRGRGLLVHGCGLLAEDGVHLFCGASGAGKSTLARVFEQHRAGTILSDDRLVLRPDGDQTRVYGTPWHGEARYAAPGHGVLRALHFLHHAPDTEAVPLRAAEAAGRLAAVCFLAGWPRADLQCVLDQCARVIGAVPCHDLGFTPDASVLSVLRSGTVGAGARP